MFSNFAVVTAATVFLTTVAAVVLIVSGGEAAAVIIALISTQLAAIMNTAKTDKVHNEVVELGNGKMKAAVKSAVHEVNEEN